IADQQPEAVLFPGDFFDGPPMDFAAAAAPWKELHPPKGIFFANGNHEQFRDSAQYDDALRAAGITVLADRMVNMDGLQIAGIDYLTGADKEKNAAALAALGLDKMKPSILIRHAPDGLRAAAGTGISLQISGHTHRGQVWPGPWL